MNAELERAKRFEEMVGKPIMTAQQRIEQMKREKELKNVQKDTPLQEVSLTEPIEQNQKAEKSDKGATVVGLPMKKKKASSGTLTFEFLLDCFKPTDINMPRIQRTIHTKKDAFEMERRLLKILGGIGTKHYIDGRRFSVSASAFYTYLLVSFFETHKEQIELLEKKLSEK